MSLRTWRGIRTPKYEHPARLGEVVMTTSSSHRARSEAEGDAALDEQEEENDRDRDQRRGGHQPTEVRRAARPGVVREPDRDRLRRPVVEQQARKDVLVPARDKGKNRGGDEPGRDERQQEPDEGSEPRRAVDHSRLLELLRDAH